MSDVTAPETRRYHRIPSIVPVHFQLLSASGAPIDPEVRTGFTRDLSMGGLCLEIHALPSTLATRVAEDPSSIAVFIDIDLPHCTLRVSGKVVWRREGQGRQLLLGIAFRGLADADGEAIEVFARRAARRPAIIKGAFAAAAVLILLGGGVYFWRVHAFEAELARSDQSLATAKGQIVQAGDQMGDMQVELRWLAVRARELVQRLDVGREGGDPRARPQRPVLDELSDNLERLSELVATECGTKE